MGWHLPNFKKAIGTVVGIVVSLASISPNDAVSNLRSFVEYFGFGVAPWFSTNGLKYPSRLAFALIGISILIWALSPAKKSKIGNVGGYMTTREVVDFLATKTDWAAKIRRWRGSATHRGLDVQTKKNPKLESFFEFQREAQKPDTKIRVFGLEDGRGKPVEIPHTFWITNGFSLSDTLGMRGDISAPTVYRNWPSGVAPYYSDLRIERRGIEETWKRMSFFDAQRERARQIKLDDWLRGRGFR